MSSLDSPIALSRSITDRIRNRVEEMVIDLEPRERQRQHSALTQRFRRELAFQRFLARVFTSQPDDWVLKGGVALQHRLDPYRASNAIDIAYIGDELGQVVVVGRLRVAVRIDLGDLFSFQLGDARASVDEDRAITIPVITSLGRQQFANFDVDIEPRREDVQMDQVDPDGPRLGIAVLDHMPPIKLIALEQRVADKVCAVFELHGTFRRPSDRSRDLGDLAMLAAQCRFDGDALTTSLRHEERRRQTGLLAHGLPGRIELAPEQLNEWPRTWREQARDPQFDFDESLAIVGRFLNPVLAGSVSTQRWQFEHGWHDA